MKPDDQLSRGKFDRELLFTWTFEYIDAFTGGIDEKKTAAAIGRRVQTTIQFLTFERHGGWIPSREF